MTELLHATTREHILLVRQLFIEYQAALGFDLCFQDFKTELATLPGEYAPPRGRLLLACQDNKTAGCAALREFSESICEMKRLYVRPEFRGGGIGKMLAVSLVSEAKKIGYEAMRLDTIPAMVEAIDIYRKLNFKEIPHYRHNPIPGALYFELRL